MDDTMIATPQSSVREDDRGYYLYSGDRYLGFIPKDREEFDYLFDPSAMRTRSALSALRRAREPLFVMLD